MKKFMLGRRIAKGKGESPISCPMVSGACIKVEGPRLERGIRPYEEQSKRRW